MSQIYVLLQNLRFNLKFTKTTAMHYVSCPIDGFFLV